MTDSREPPLEIELLEMIQAASEVDDPMAFKIIDIQIAKRKRDREKASQVVRMLDDGAA